jgi:hypothetical protein
MGYSFVTQLFPSLVLSLARHNIATREGAAAGIIAGVATVVAVSLTGVNFHKLPWLPAGPGPQHRHRCAGREFHRADRRQLRDAPRLRLTPPRNRCPLRRVGRVRSYYSLSACSSLANRLDVSQRLPPIFSTSE